MEEMPAHEVLEDAKTLLRQHGVDPDNLSRGQLYAFASSGAGATEASLESYLANLKLSDASQGENGVEEHPGDEGTALSAAQDLLHRCHELMDELKMFKEYLAEKGKTATVEYKSFRDALDAEERYLVRLTNSNPGQEQIQHNINSSNLPYYEAVWAAAKRSHEIVKFRKWFYRDKPLRPTQARRKGPKRNNDRFRAMVDVVAESGDLWIKVSTITNQRILFDLAKLGWQNDDMDSDSDMEDAKRPDSDSDDEDEIPLVQTAKDLVKAARGNPIRGKNPRVNVVLPRIFSNRSRDNGAVDFVLNKIRALGVTVTCAQDIQPTPSIQKVLPRLLVDEFKGITQTLNVDCTVLLALVSDISHQEVEQQPWFPNAVNQQILVERKSKLLPTLLYPVMAGRDLVCTEEAALRMQEIVETIGTKTEVVRTAVLLGLNEYASCSSQELIQHMQKYSNHPVPSDWKLPIKVVDKDSKGKLSTLHRLAQLVEPQLTGINPAVFLFGWASGYTTISSNATVAHQIEKIIEENRQRGEEEVTGPMVWLCAESRSLVAKRGRGDFGKSTVQDVIR